MNYPNGMKYEKNNFSKTPISYKNRGMTLENDLNNSNEYYKFIDRAHIYKKPTPIKIVKVDYPSRNKAKITEAYFAIPSTTDYNGIYKGKYIDFEAKETKSKTSFALSNIHKHQITHLKNVEKHGGISFIIVRFTILNKTYLILPNDFINYIENNDKKSIPIEYFEQKGYLLKDNYRPSINYLDIVDQIIGGKNGKEN